MMDGCMDRVRKKEEAQKVLKRKEECQCRKEETQRGEKGWMDRLISKDSVMKMERKGRK